MLHKFKTILKRAIHHKKGEVGLLTPIITAVIMAAVVFALVPLANPMSTNKAIDWLFARGYAVASPDTPETGDMLYYDGENWVDLDTGTAGYYLETQGEGLPPTWSEVVEGDSFPAGTQGDILYYNGAAWVTLGYSTSGYFLETQGIGANPTWSAPTFTVYTNTVTVMASGGDYTQLSDAFAAINDATINKRYLFEVYGVITDDTRIDAENYIDVVGYNAYISVDTGDASMAAYFTSITDSTWQNITIDRTGTGGSGARGVKIAGDTTNGCKFINVHFKSSVSTGSGCVAWDIQGNAAPYLENCTGTAASSGAECYAFSVSTPTGTNLKPILKNCKGKGGSGGTDCIGLLVQGNYTYEASPIVIGGYYEGGDGYTSCPGVQQSYNGAGIYDGVVFKGGNTDSSEGGQLYGLSHGSYTGCTFIGGDGGGDGLAVHGYAYPDLVGCRIIAGLGAGSDAAVFSVYGSGTYTGCTFTPRPIGTGFAYDDADNGQFRPFAGVNYQLVSINVLVRVAHGGYTLDIGTSIGGAQIKANVPLDSTGWAHTIMLSQPAIAADGYMYATPSSAISDGDVEIYYTVYEDRGSCEAISMQSGGNPIFSGCTAICASNSTAFYATGSGQSILAWLWQGGIIKNLSSGDSVGLSGATADVPIYNALLVGSQTNVTNFDAGTARGTNTEI